MKILKIQQNIFQIIYITLATIMLILILATLIFLKNNLLKTLSDTNKILSLRNSVVSEQLNRNQWDIVIEKIHNKSANNFETYPHIDPFDPDRNE